MGIEDDNKIIVHRVIFLEPILSFIVCMFWIAFILTVLVIVRNYYVYRSMAAVKTTQFKFLFRPLFCLCASPILLFGIPVFFLYKYVVVHFMLRMKHGSSYGGIIDGRDSVYNLENENPAHVLIIVQYKPTKGRSFYERVRNRAYKELVVKGKHHPKIFGIVKMYMGYTYLLKNKLTFNDCIKQLQIVNTDNGEITKEDLLRIMEDSCETPLPKDRAGLWDAYIGTQPVQWENNTPNNDLKSYPIIFRMNHTLADAKHLIFGIFGLFGDSSEMKVGCRTINLTTMYEGASRRICSLNFIRGLAFQIKYCFRLCYVMFLSPAVLFVNALLMADDTNTLHGPRLIYKKHFLLNVDGKSSNYVQIAKRIKRKIPNCTFADVFLTAMAANFREYFQKNAAFIPNYILAEAPVPPPFDLADLRPPQDRIHCRNRLSFGVRKLPINVDFENTNTPLINLLQSIKKEGVYLRTSVEHEVNYFILRIICNLVPVPLLKPLMDMFHDSTSLISNIPGPCCLTALNGCIIQDIAAWTATRGLTGIGYGIFTYDERLQLSLVIDKTLVTDKSSIQCLLDGVYKYLDMLDAEVRQYL